MLSIAPQTGQAFLLKKGQHLWVMDPEGEQVSDLFCINLHDKNEALSSGRSIDYNDTIRFNQGHKLYSMSGNIMLEILTDTCGVHDFLVTPCSLQMFQMLDPDCHYHPSCQENLIQALSAFGVSPQAITTTFNIFMNVPVESNGKIHVQKPLSKSGDRIEFKAHMDLIVGLTACSDEGTNNGKCKAIHYCVKE